MDHIISYGLRFDLEDPCALSMKKNLLSAFLELSRPEKRRVLTRVLMLSSILGALLAPMVVLGNSLIAHENEVGYLRAIINLAIAGGFILGGLSITLFFVRKENLRYRLRGAEAFHETFLNESHDWQQWSTDNGAYKYISPACERITGYAPEQFAADPDLETAILHPDDRAAFIGHGRCHFDSNAGRFSDHMQYRIITRDGQVRWLDHYCHPIYSRGKYLGRYIVNRDVTAEKKKSRILRESVDLVNATLESSDDHIAVLDGEGNIIMVNGAWRKFAAKNHAAVGPDDWVGINYLSCCSDAGPFASDGAGDARRGLRRILDGMDTRFEYEYPCHSPNEEHWFLLRAVPLRGPGGLLVAHTDITERKKAERELKLAASSFESSEPILITDAHGRIIRVNEAFSAVTGYTLEEVRGRTPGILKSGRHGVEFYNRMWATVRESGFWEGELWNRRKSGELYAEHLRIRAIRNDLGETINYIGAFSDISKQKQAEEQVHMLAFYDSLTGLPNKTLMMERIQQALWSAKLHEKNGAVLLIDLRDTKTINDSMGHAAGDSVLKEIAERLKAEVGELNTVARIGGDEFAVLLAETDDSSPEAYRRLGGLAQRIQTAVEKPIHLDGNTLNISANIGIDFFPASDDTSGEILKRVATALHRAQASNVHNIMFFREEMHAEVRQRLSLVGELREAIRDNQFLVHYQPQVLRGKVVGLEALVRWRHPVKGLISPAKFIPAAEEAGLILDIGELVLKLTCRSIHTLQKTLERHEIRRVSVNVSGVQFRRDDFIARVVRVLEAAEIDPTWLELEITESILMHDTDDVIRKINILRNYGVRWAIDDFGTGFSSLSYLKNLPCDSLKIDRSFVQNAHVNLKNQAIIRAIISMAGNLGMGVVGEGVEKTEEADFLTSAGCELLQGYLFGRPAPLDALLENRQ